jgi:hypothetical protein
MGDDESSGGRFHTDSSSESSRFPYLLWTWTGSLINLPSKEKNVKISHKTSSSSQTATTSVKTSISSTTKLQKVNSPKVLHRDMAN